METSAMAGVMAAAVAEDATDQNDVLFQNAAANDINTIKTGAPLPITPGIFQRFPLFNSARQSLPA